MTEPTTQEPITSDVECGEPQTGQIRSGVTLHFSFDNSIERDVSFSTCFSSIDTQLFLYDANYSAIQSQSTNHCDSDDCHDSSVFADCPSRTETFTMRALPIGHYELDLRPYSSGGSYDLRVICGASTLPAVEPTLEPTTFSNVPTSVPGEQCSTAQCRTDCDYEQCKCKGYDAAECYVEWYGTSMPQDHADFGAGARASEDCQTRADQCDLCCSFEQCQCWVSELGENNDCVDQYPAADGCSAYSRSAGTDGGRIVMAIDTQHDKSFSFKLDPPPSLTKTVQCTAVPDFCCDGGSEWSFPAGRTDYKSGSLTSAWSEDSPVTVTCSTSDGSYASGSIVMDRRSTGLSIPVALFAQYV